MWQETESVFDYILRQDRDLLELLDGDYTFSQRALARFYASRMSSARKCAW